MDASISVSGILVWTIKFIFRKIIFLPLCAWKHSTQTFPQFNDFILYRTLKLQLFKLKLERSSQSSNQKMKNISVWSNFMNTVESKVDWVEELICPLLILSRLELFYWIEFWCSSLHKRKEIKTKTDVRRTEIQSSNQKGHFAQFVLKRRQRNDVSQILWETERT